MVDKWWTGDISCVGLFDPSMLEGVLKAKQCRRGERKATLTLQVLLLGRHHLVSGGFADTTGHIGSR